LIFVLGLIRQIYCRSRVDYLEGALYKTAVIIIIIMLERSIISLKRIQWIVGVKCLSPIFSTY